MQVALGVAKCISLGFGQTVFVCEKQEWWEMVFCQVILPPPPPHVSLVGLPRKISTCFEVLFPRGAVKFGICYDVFC